MPTEAETLAALLEAAKQIGEVTGRDLLEGMVVLEENPLARVGIRTHGYDSMGYETPIVNMLPDHLAIDILESRVWRAVREWEAGMVKRRTHPDDFSGRVYATAQGIGIHWEPRDVFGTAYPDLPSAVAAIHKHWKESK